MPKKKTDAQLFREWKIYSPTFRKKNLRYQNPIEKGIYWYWFSLDVRQRDVENFGVCISCGKPITVDTAQAGHFIAASVGGRDLLFDPRNVNAECGRCNAFDEGHLLGYERRLDERYGPGTAQELKDRYWQYKESKIPLKDWKGSEYADMIRALKSYQQAELHDAEHE